MNPKVARSIIDSAKYLPVAMSSLVPYVAITSGSCDTLDDGVHDLVVLEMDSSRRQVASSSRTGQSVSHAR